VIILATRGDVLDSGLTMGGGIVGQGLLILADVLFQVGSV